MKKIVRFLKAAFTPKDLHGIDMQEILAALADEGIRKQWIFDVLTELKRMNLEIDRRLVNNHTFALTDLAARRKAYQDVLEGILSAKRQLRSQNPKPKLGQFDLDSVTVEPAYL